MSVNGLTENDPGVGLPQRIRRVAKDAFELRNSVLTDM